MSHHHRTYTTKNHKERKKQTDRKQQKTHNWKLSLNTGDQLLLFDLVASLRFLLLKFGPMMLTSTNGRNMPFVTHLMLLTATTEMQTVNLQFATCRAVIRRHHRATHFKSYGL